MDPSGDPVHVPGPAAVPRRLLALALTICCLGGAVAGEPNGALAITPAQARALGVETAQATVVAEPGTGSGFPAQVVVPNNQLHVVSAPLAGLVEHVAVAADQPVRRGQLLARLASPALAEIQRGFLQAAAQHQLAKENAERDALLLAEGIIAEARARASRAAALEAAAAYAERRQALRLAGLSDAAVARLEAGRGGTATVEVSAPIDGVVLEQMATAGQRVEAAAPLFRVGRLNPLWLEIQVPAAQTGALATGAAVTVSGTRAGGAVLTVGRQLGGSQTATVRASVTDPAGQLRPGQFVEAVVGTAARPGDGPLWRVPVAALVRNEGQAGVFVHTAEGFRLQTVRVVSEGPDGAVVGAALAADARVVVRGTAALKARLAGIGTE